MLNDPLANTLSKIGNAERRCKNSCMINPFSTVIKNVLRIMQDEGYIGETEEISKAKGGILKVHLLNNINECNVIKPRFAVKMTTYQKYEKRYLPAKNIGILIVSTSKGILTHDEAKKKGIGGKLLAYVY